MLIISNVYILYISSFLKQYLTILAICNQYASILSFEMKNLLPYIQIILSVILVICILLQRTGAQVGGAFGGSDNFSSAFHTRRGLEKTLFGITIAVAILFAISALANLL